ncbi:MAG TPA: NAD(P)H-hydrate dehydratase [Ilumatobacteraceae bacterium]|nr:NAD(P)H-hydrate dehydratase [Ilumatobacteraceae bacterium]
MVPIVTPDEMRAVDATATEATDVLIERAGAAVARAAIRLMGGTYGRTVHVIAGKGNNGADGRVAARLLAQRGVRVMVHDAADCPAVLPDAHLAIDAAYGTGFRGTWSPPDVGTMPVLAVDIPSGVDALTGEAPGPVLAAERTVTFAALKPGLLVPPGSDLAGRVEVADIGLQTGVRERSTAALVEGADVASWVPVRSSDAHKWNAALRVVAGSPGMTGAAALVASAAFRAGAGMVHLSAPSTFVPSAPVETVQRTLTSREWAAEVLRTITRFHALVVGPGLGREDGTAEQVRALVQGAAVPAVIDGDGLFAMAWSADGAAAVLRGRSAPTVLTPHDGEYALLHGTPVGADRIAAARSLAHKSGCVVLLKGPATIIAAPDAPTRVVTAGDARLATAGTGDVLAGIIGALLACGVPAAEAAAAGAWLHGRAAMRAPDRGMVASDIAPHLPAVLAELDHIVEVAE